MKKKLIAAMLIMLISFTGCAAVNLLETGVSGGNAENLIGQENKDAGTLPKEDVSGGEQSSAQKDATGYLDWECEYHSDSYYEDILLMNGHYDTLYLKTEGYPALSEAVASYNRSRSVDFQKYFDVLKESAMEIYKEYGADSFIGPYVAESQMHVRRGDMQVLSLVETCYSYEGGAHGNSFYTSLNLDVQTGREIALEETVSDKTLLPGILAAELLEKYPDTTFWTEDLEELLKEYVEPSEEEYAPSFTWTLDYEGITFYFSDYELSSYADGCQEITLTYTEYPKLLNADYFEKVDKHYVSFLTDNRKGWNMDINGDGMTDYVNVSAGYNTEFNMYDSISVTVNGNVFEQEIYFYDYDTYFVKSEDDNYLYIQHRSDSDFESVSVYRITENSVEYIDDFSNSLVGFSNSLHFKVSKRMDMLSTYNALAECTLGENGMPKETDGVYIVEGEVLLTSTDVISAKLLDEEGNLTETVYDFPAGTEFTLRSTDGASYVDVEAGDGKGCRFYTNPGWPPVINGQDAESCFEALWYAG